MLRLEGEVERRALIDVRLGPDAAAVSIDDALHYGQPDAGAVEFTVVVETLECAEQFSGVSHIESRAVVTDVKHACDTVRRGTDFDARMWSLACVFPRV